MSLLFTCYLFSKVLLFFIKIITRIRYRRTLSAGNASANRGRSPRWIFSRCFSRWESPPFTPSSNSKTTLFYQGYKEIIMCDYLLNFVVILVPILLCFSWLTDLLTISGHPFFIKLLIAITLSAF